MKNTLRRLGLGTILWAASYAASIPLLPLMEADISAFKALMVFIGSVVSAILTVYYFNGVEKNFLREGIALAATWLAVNWFLDFIALIPFSHQTFAQYFAQIGIEYVGLMAPVIAIGYILESRTPRRV